MDIDLPLCRRPHPGGVVVTHRTDDEHIAIVGHDERSVFLNGEQPQDGLFDDETHAVPDGADERQFAEYHKAERQLNELALRPRRSSGQTMKEEPDDSDN